MTQALGYLSLPSECAGDGREQVVNVAAGGLAAFAQRAGYRLAGVFTDVRGQSEHGFSALVSALRSHGAGAVVVPEIGHLRQVGCLGGRAATAARFLQATCWSWTQLRQRLRRPGRRGARHRSGGRAPGTRAAGRRGVVGARR